MIYDAKRLKAILILGPTGSGKTPLGNLMQKKGFNIQKCYHFDFGENLRLIANSKKPDKRFSTEEIILINKVLASGALLGNKHFYIAKKILNRFIKRNLIGPNALIILNGLPRHIGQAKEVALILNIKLVINLSCAIKVLQTRIRKNKGGDRTGRTDDNTASVRNKIAIYNQRTAKLIDYYRSAGARIIRIPINENTLPEDILYILTDP